MKAIKNWERHIARWERSEMNKRQYCKLRSLPYYSFLYHYRKRTSDQQESGFREVILKHEAVSERIELSYVDGCRVSFPLLTSADVMKMFLSL